MAGKDKSSQAVCEVDTGGRASVVHVRLRVASTETDISGLWLTTSALHESLQLSFQPLSLLIALLNSNLIEGAKQYRGVRSYRFTTTTMCQLSGCPTRCVPILWSG